MNNSIALYISIFILALASGCATQWHGPRGHGVTSPVYSEYESSAEFRTCLEDRREQREQRVGELCRLAGGRCSESRTVSMREATRLVCEQSDGMADESRVISRADCERLLADDGIPDDATGTVTTITDGTDPRLAWLTGASSVLFQDDHSFCMAAMAGYGTPTAGGMLPVGGVPVGSVGGTVPGLSVGLLGSTVGVPGVGGFGGVPVGSTGTLSNFTFDATGNPYAVRVTVTPVGGVGAGSTFLVQPRSRLPVPLSRAIRYHVARECVDPVTGIVTARLPDTIVDPAQSPFPMAITQYICESPAYRL